MDQDKSAIYKFTELVSLRKIEAEFWNILERNLKEDNHYAKVNLKPLIKLQKSLNNTMMKLISKTTDDLDVAKAPPAPVVLDSVDEVEGFVNVPQSQPMPFE